MQSKESIDLDLSRYFAGLKRRWLVAINIFTVTVALSALSTTLLKSSYEAEGKLLFKVPSFKIIGQNLLASGSEAEGDLKSLVSSQNPINTEIEVLSSPMILDKVIEELNLKNKQGKPLNSNTLKSGLTLKIIGGTDVLRVAYKSRNPEEGAAIVNKVMDLYLENSILTSRSEAEKTRMLIAQQLNQPKLNLQRAELALRSFKEQNKIVNLAEESKLAVLQINNLDTQVANVSSELEKVTSKNNTLRKQISLDVEQAIAINDLSQSQAIQSILTQIQQVEQKLALERSRFLDNDPKIVDLETNKKNLQDLLQKQTNQIIGSQVKLPQTKFPLSELKQSMIREFLQSEQERLSLIKKLNSLSKSRADYEQRLRIIPQLEQNLGELEQNLESARSTYQTLLTKVQELRLAESKNTASARIIANALVPDKPDSRNKIIVILLGILFGIFLSITTVLFLEIRDRSLKTIQEIREIFEYTLLGIIPSATTKKITSSHRDVELTNLEVAVRDTPDSLTSEMYRMIQANLRFLSSDQVLKNLVITSALPREGKSTVSANLAAAIAQLGRRVLLIDGDMRSPSQHQFWQLNNLVGLSEVLVGQVEFITAISKVMDNLDVLTAGVRPPNPLALLDSKRMAALIADFSSQYDFVIIDAPPLLVAADSLTLSHMTDGILLVSRPNVIDSGSAWAAKDTLERSGQKVLGLLINGVTEKNEFSSDFYVAKKHEFDETKKWQEVVPVGQTHPNIKDQ
ncbi:GumC family protein [Anabaena sp. CCY 9910]|uniref:GumC family protein n=1 Tax=Anabaena sp. CCY 9910 TaxID=3103870 RepID=UPI0039E1C6FA